MGYGHNACAGAAARLRSEGNDPALWPLNECRLEQAIQELDSTVDVDLRAVVPDPFSLSAVQSSLANHSSLRFYLYSGQLDLFVPVERFQEEAQLLWPRGFVTYRHFPQSGHDGYTTEPQVWQDLRY